MDDSCTVIIGSRDHFESLKARAPRKDELLCFSDDEALAALDAIDMRKPHAIVLDGEFAETPRGAALINRVRSDPSLADAKVTIVSANNATGPIDEAGTRSVKRFRMTEGTEVQLDGGLAEIVDLSVRGAQVLSRYALKPHQHIRIVLADDLGMVRLNAAVAWASFEIPGGISRYRAGVEFTNPEAGAVEAFCMRHKT